MTRQLRVGLALAALALLLHAPLALAQGVAGNWTITLQTDQGNVDADLSLKSEGGDKITGMMTSPMGEVPLTGTFADGKLKLTATIDAGGQAFTMTFNGALAGDAMKGDVDFGGLGSATWTAARNK
jgi:hypothetical protein